MARYNPVQESGRRVAALAGITVWRGADREERPNAVQGEQQDRRPRAGVLAGQRAQLLVAEVVVGVLRLHWLPDAKNKTIR